MRPIDNNQNQSITIQPGQTRPIDFDNGFYLSVTEADGEILFKPEQTGAHFPSMGLIVGAVIPIPGGFHRMNFINATGAAVTIKYLLAVADVDLPPSIQSVTINDSTAVRTTGGVKLIKDSLNSLAGLRTVPADVTKMILAVKSGACLIHTYNNSYPVFDLYAGDSTGVIPAFEFTGDAIVGSVTAVTWLKEA